MKIISVILLLITTLLFGAAAQAQRLPDAWKKEWPHTDFSKSNVDFSEILSGGPPKDGIPAIEVPRFKPVADIHDIKDQEPVILLEINQDARAYPLGILMWHEIANDEVGGVPVAVTYCPLCNAAIVFDRRLGDLVLDFGVSGKLRYSDMIMYDRQTQSWWQQFTGEGIVGDMTDKKLAQLPARIVPFSTFKEKHPNGMVLVPANPKARGYGENPYVKYDSLSRPFLYDGEYDGPGSPLSYVVAVGKEAWLLEDLRKLGQVNHGKIRLTWREGMSSALDKQRIDRGRDIGYVTVEREADGGVYKDIPHHMVFAFAFKAFHTDGVIHKVPSP